MKHNKFVKILEMILVSLPLIYVGGVGAYTIFNKNAKDSYSDYYTAKEFAVNGSSLEQVNNRYSVNLKTFSDNANGYKRLGSGRFTYSDLSINWNDYKPSNQQALSGEVLSSIDNVSIYKGNPSNQLLILHLYSGETSIATWYYNTLPSIISETFYFTLLDLPTFNEGSYQSDYNTQSMYMISYVQSTLDGALPYAMNEFNKLGFGKVDFVSWFTNIFMTNNTNNVYVTFVNSYLNYFIMVETIYFLPMVLYWFIHFGESVITHFANKEDWK